jgi:hypothetical protein
MSTPGPEVQLTPELQATLERLVNAKAARTTSEVHQLARNVAELAHQVNALVLMRQLPPYQEVVLAAFTHLLATRTRGEGVDEEVFNHNLALDAYQMADAMDKIGVARMKAASAAKRAAEGKSEPQVLTVENGKVHGPENLKKHVKIGGQDG